jgi:hypothetical protein
MEDLVYYPTRQYIAFSNGLRNVINRLSSYFTLLMNFTLTAPEAFEDIQTVLGDALTSRVTSQVYFKEPSEEEAYVYVVDLLSQFRTKDPIDLDLPRTYPFTEGSLRALIHSLLERTPRYINLQCSKVIKEALQQDVISEIGDVISEEFISEFQQAQLDSDLGGRMS